MGRKKGSRIHVDCFRERWDSIERVGIWMGRENEQLPFLVDSQWSIYPLTAGMIVYSLSFAFPTDLPPPPRFFPVRFLNRLKQLVYMMPSPLRNACEIPQAVHNVVDLKAFLRVFPQ